jgi:hypothetical protein
MLNKRNQEKTLKIYFQMIAVLEKKELSTSENNLVKRAKKLTEHKCL